MLTAGRAAASARLPGDGLWNHRPSLRQGALGYEFVLYSHEGLIVDVQLGRTSEPIGIHFGLDPETAGDWCSRDTLRFSSGGLFIPEQRTVDNAKTLPAAFVGKLDLWKTLDAVATIANGAPLPETLELASAPEWKLDCADGNWTHCLSHAFAGLSFQITPMLS